jgi:hypothetical protein
VEVIILKEIGKTNGGVKVIGLEEGVGRAISSKSRWNDRELVSNSNT